MGHQTTYKEHVPAAKFWKKEGRLYYCDYDDLMGAMVACPLSTLELKAKLGVNSYQSLESALFGKAIDPIEVYFIEIALGLFKPKWREAFVRD